MQFHTTWQRNELAKRTLAYTPKMKKKNMYIRELHYTVQPTILFEKHKNTKKKKTRSIREHRLLQLYATFEQTLALRDALFQNAADAFKNE